MKKKINSNLSRNTLMRHAEPLSDRGWTFQGLIHSIAVIRDGVIIWWTFQSRCMQKRMLNICGDKNAMRWPQNAKFRRKHSGKVVDFSHNTDMPFNRPQPIRWMHVRWPTNQFWWFRNERNGCHRRNVTRTQSSTVYTVNMIFFLFMLFNFGRRNKTK